MRGPDDSPEHAAANAGAPFLSQRLPRVEHQGGPFIRHPKVVTITFRGDRPEFVAHLERFGETITHTAWWRSVTEGYCDDESCIGEGLPAIAVRLAMDLPAELRAVDIAEILRRASAANLVPLDADTVLLVYLPPAVALSDAFTRYCGGGPQAFHRSLRLGSRNVPYAVVPRCSDETALTARASHELLEATTNPDPSRRGFAFEASAANAGFTAAGLEPVDACGLVTHTSRDAHEGDFAVQRAWSNRAAAAGHDPCVPALPERPYVALVPAQPAPLSLREGESVTLVLTAASDRAVKPWTVAAVEIARVGGSEPCLALVLDRATVAPGDTVRLTVTMVKRPARERCVIGLLSTLDGETSLWPVAVLTK